MWARGVSHRTRCLAYLSFARSITIYTIALHRHSSHVPFLSRDDDPRSEALFSRDAAVEHDGDPGGQDAHRVLLAAFGSRRGRAHRADGARAVQQRQSVLRAAARSPRARALLRTVCQHDGIQHENFELACRSRGLLRDDDEAAQVLADADRAGDSGYELRSLLVHYFMQGASVAELLDDKAFRFRLASDLPGSPSEAEQLAFLDIEDRLHFLGRSLHDFAPAFAPQHVSTEAQREKALWDVDSQRALADSSELELDTLPGTPEQSMLHVCDAGRLTSRIRPDAASTIPYREVVRR